MIHDTIVAFNLLEDRLMEWGRRVRDENPDDHDAQLIHLAQYNTVIELLHIVSGVRNVLVERATGDLSRILREAAPAGANPTLTVTTPLPSHTSQGHHPSNQPRLRVVKETPDANDD